MRILIALAFLAGCDDSGSNGLLPPTDALFAGDGPIGCHDYSGATPEDWVDPDELAAAEAADVRGCFLHVRLITLSYNRCTTGTKATVVSLESVIGTCEAQPDGFEGFTECFEVWASGTCNEIADSPPLCARNVALARDQGKLACP